MEIFLNSFILINVEREKVWRVTEQSQEINGVKIAHAVTGQYDVVAYADFLKLNDLSDIITQIQTIDGVTRTITAIAKEIK